MRRVTLFLLALVAAPCWALAADVASNSETFLVSRRAQRLTLVPAPQQPPQADLPANNAIDQFIVAKWREAKLDTGPKGPELCDDATFARRVYLDLTGVVPNVADLNRFLADASTDKRAKLIDQLLARSADYAAHWTPFWEDALASQPVLAQGGVPTRGNYRNWIFRSFERNRPYDVMVAELIDPTMPGRHAAATQDILGEKHSIEYIRNEDHTATLQTASNVAQVFLGTGMKCASCHDHFENREWTQQRFLGFASLFAPHDLEQIRCEVRSGKQVPAAFPFAIPNAPATPPTELTARLHVLALLIVDPTNPRFAKTIVNRLWKRYLGLGLYEPADDFRGDFPASHPQLLDWLAYDFIEHGCDLQHTIRLILNSRTYQLSYDAAVEDQFDVAKRSLPRYYRSPSLRRLTAEQLVDSIRLVATGKLEPAERNFLDARSTALTRALGRPASRNEISTARPDDVAVVQALELLNGREFHELVYQNPLVSEASVKQDPRRAVDRLYRAALSRPATINEKNVGRAFLSGNGSTPEMLGDMLWALVGSPEFQYVH